jgi:hypothetical protein
MFCMQSGNMGVKVRAQLDESAAKAVVTVHGQIEIRKINCAKSSAKSTAWIRILTVMFAL